jgi:hypothetical protein
MSEEALTVANEFFLTTPSRILIKRGVYTKERFKRGIEGGNRYKRIVETSS